MTNLEDNKPILPQDTAPLEVAPEACAPIFEIIDTDTKKERVVHLGKWLWAARFFKTKELAISAIKSGAVTYNYDNAYHNQEIYVGDVITIKYGKNSKTVQVTGLSTRRRNINDAGQLYKEEHSKSRTPREDATGKRQYHNKRNQKPYNKSSSSNYNKQPALKENKSHNTSKEEPNYNREHSQPQFPSDFAAQHFLDRAQKWYDEPDADDHDD